MNQGVQEQRLPHFIQALAFDAREEVFAEGVAKKERLEAGTDPRDREDEGSPEIGGFEELGRLGRPVEIQSGVVRTAVAGPVNGFDPDDHVADPAAVVLKQHGHVHALPELKNELQDAFVHPVAVGRMAIKSFKPGLRRFFHGPLIRPQVDRHLWQAVANCKDALGDRRQGHRKL